jgi:hypothetical protein
MSLNFHVVSTCKSGKGISDRIEHDRVFELRRHLADDVDALGFELLEVGEGIAGHAGGLGLGARARNEGALFWQYRGVVPLDQRRARRA